MACRKNQSTAKVGPKSKKSSLLFHQSMTAIILASNRLWNSRLRRNREDSCRLGAGGGEVPAYLQPSPLDESLLLTFRIGDP